MITCHRHFLEQRCRERGYSLMEVMPCVTARDGDQWTIDPDHIAYPRESRLTTCLAGTELKAILRKYLGIEATPNCACTYRAAVMDGAGCQWVRENLDEVVGWLREEAQSRGLPFLDAAGKQLVLLAIRRAEAKSKVAVQSSAIGT